METKVSTSSDRKNPLVTCPKCGCQTRASLDRCTVCGRHLRVYCYACGEPNLRSQVACSSCFTLLHAKHHHLQRPKGSFIRVDRLGEIVIGVGVALIAAPFILILFSPDGLFGAVRASLLERYDPVIVEIPVGAVVAVNLLTILLFAGPPLALLWWLVRLNGPQSKTDATAKELLG